MTNKKLELTRTLIKELPEEQKITLGDAMSTWWISKMTQNSFRLTDVGCDTFVKVLDIKYYSQDTLIEKTYVYHILIID